MSSFRRFLSRRWLLAFLGVAALLFGLAMLHPYPRQSLFGPTIRGKPWCVWEAEVRHYVHRDDYDKTLWARSMRWLGVTDAQIDGRELFDHEEMLPLLVELAADPDSQIRLNSLAAILRYNSLPSAEALPVLRRQMGHDFEPENRVIAAVAVWLIAKDKKALSVLQQELRNPQWQVRARTLGWLRTHGEDWHDLSSDIAVCASDPNVNVRVYAIYALRKVGKHGLNALIRSLEDEDEGVRQTAVNVLRDLHSDAKTAIPALERRLHDNNQTVRECAASALREIDPDRFQHLIPQRKIE